MRLHTLRPESFAILAHSADDVTIGMPTEVPGGRKNWLAIIDLPARGGRKINQPIDLADAVDPGVSGSRSGQQSDADGNIHRRDHESDLRLKCGASAQDKDARNGPLAASRIHHRP
jgi:hypothetical protein